MQFSPIQQMDFFVDNVIGHENKLDLCITLQIRNIVEY